VQPAEGARRLRGVRTAAMKEAIADFERFLKKPRAHEHEHETPVASTPSTPAAKNIAPGPLGVFIASMQAHVQPSVPARYRGAVV
jgi:hypothetical protein